MKQLDTDDLQAREAFSDYSFKSESEGKFYLLKSASLENSEAAERVVAELREKLSSEFEVYRKDKNVFVVREFIEGGLPESAIDSPMEALERIIEIAESLEGRLHGNLKPENIIRNEDGNWVAVDCGIRAFHELVRKCLGAGLQYLAPEQIRGECTEKSDVYALGMIFGKLLCGNTPFDGKPEDLLLREKQEGTPDWSIIANTPSEVRKIVERATANDINSRHQSIAEFLEDCRSAKSLLAGGQTPPPPPPLEPEEDDDVPLSPNKRFVLVGHTGAGKTVLAAGLYATFSRSKSLSVEAADEPTKQLSNNFKSILETGTWPAATTGAAQKLCFRIAHNRDAAELDFDEYMGERVGDVESYIRDILKEPNGVLLLMNPGGLQFRLKGDDDTPQELAIRRNKLLSDLKSIIDYLFKLKIRPSVALVVTASGRLKTDLKDFAPEFNRYVEEIETALDTRDKNWWKRFEVSVCGELEDQTHPKLNPQGIEDPFLWLTERYNAVVRKKRVTKFLTQTACGLSLLALSAAAWWGVDWYRASAPEKECRACIAEFSGNNELDELSACAEKLVKIRRTYCAENHITENHGKRVANCGKTCSPFFLYPDRKREFEKNIKNLEIKIDVARANYLEAKVDLALKKATEDNCKVAEDVAAWIPLQSNEIKTRFDALKTVCEKEIPVARELYAYKELGEKLKAIIQTPKNGVLESLSKEVDAFCVLPPAETKEVHDSRSKDLSEKLSQARDSVFKYNAEELLVALKEKNPERIDDLIPIVKEWNAFKARKNVGVPQKLIDSYLQSISEVVSSKVLGTFKKLFEAYRNKRLESEEFIECKFVKDWHEKIVPIATDFNDACRVWAEKNFEQLKKDWDDKMRLQIDYFIVSVKGLSAVEQFRRLKEYYAERGDNPQNPYVENAEVAIYDNAMDFFYKIMAGWNNSEEDYMQIKYLCSAIKATPSRTIQSRKLYQFANTYLSWLDSYSRRITVLGGEICDQGRAEGIFVRNKFYVESIHDSYGKFCAGKSEVLKSGWYNYPNTSWTFNLKKPWDKYCLTVKLRESGFWGTGERTCTYSWNNPGDYPAGKDTMKWDDFVLNIDVSGKTIRDIVNEVFAKR